MENEELKQLLILLRKYGVTHYKTGDLELELNAPSIALPRDPEDEEEDKKASRASPNEQPARGRATSLYEDPSLWPGGKRPSFEG